MTAATNSKKDEYVTHKDLDAFGDKLHQRIVEDISGVIQSFADQVDRRFSKVEAEIKLLNEKYDHLIETLDHFLKRLDNMEADNAARDAQFARLERRIEQLEKQLDTAR